MYDRCGMSDRFPNKMGNVPTVVTDELVEEVAECLATRMKKHAIKAHIIDILDMAISARSLEKLMARARSILLERSKRPRAEHLALSLDFWEKVLCDDDASLNQKMKAQRELQDLLGIGGSFAGANTDTPDEQAHALRETMEEMAGLHTEVSENGASLNGDPGNVDPGITDSSTSDKPTT